ncbi:glycosyltransferase family 39 protein [Psychromonas aquatilis]|uniref:Glycosyltransferase family 39 protein n=1 Tax=Psychromonas aquatilis TaxID=2005072 RepID=A0ABU9GRB5_9GAMM
MRKSSIGITIFITVIMLIRLVSLQLYPLMDTTEARYGEMARLMVETNNWVTPLFNYDVPFWGKPPMQTWVSALSGKILGISEFSLRFPHFISGILTILLVGYFAYRKRMSPSLSMFILLTCAGFYIASGAIMTDSLLTLSMTLSMFGFYFGWQNHSKRYAYLGFVGIGLGLLIKGPLIIVLIGLSIVPWIIINYKVLEGAKQFWLRIPIFSGLLLSLIIAGPWYAIAEQATPGFLHYFLVGEHWSRFTVSGWSGDLYGSAHDEPRGMIWLFWLYIAFPWSLVLLYRLIKSSKKSVFFTDSESKSWHTFLLCWLISPMLLFTFSGNILPMYVLPGLPAIALLLASIKQPLSRVEISIGCFAPVVVLCLLIFGKPIFEAKSDAVLISATDKKFPVYYINNDSFSGRFYTQGQAKIWPKENQKVMFPYYIVTANNQIKNNMKILNNCRFKANNRKRSLYFCSSDHNE